jgi:hypothetical protein
VRNTNVTRHNIGQTFQQNTALVRAYIPRTIRTNLQKVSKPTCLFPAVWIGNLETEWFEERRRLRREMSAE